MSTDGRIKIDSLMVTGAPGNLLKPGAGFSEWFKDHEQGPEMVVVPAGSFTMGSPASEPEREPWEPGTESPQFKVSINWPFAIGRDAILRREFAAFVAATGYQAESGALVLKGEEWLYDPLVSWRDPGFDQGESHPVVCISWNDAKAYVAWLAAITGQPYRLLGEAEWEYAARAGSETPFWWGSTIAPAQANYKATLGYGGGGSIGEFRGGTVPAASFEPNPWGLFNVHGNVWEWCEDAWHSCYDSAPTDGSAWLEGGDGSRHILRGGSWINYPRFLRSAVRFGFSAEARAYNFGFRIGRTLAVQQED